MLTNLRKTQESQASYSEDAGVGRTENWRSIKEALDSEISEKILRKMKNCTVKYANKENCLQIENMRAELKTFKQDWRIKLKKSPR